MLIITYKLDNVEHNRLLVFAITLDGTKIINNMH